MMKKLKILPPTLREKKRYVAFRIYSENMIHKDSFPQYLWNNIINLYGEIHASRMNIWVIDFEHVKYENNINEYYAIVKCQRGYEDDFITMLHTLTHFRKRRVVIHIIAKSGTIHAIRKKI